MNIDQWLDLISIEYKIQGKILSAEQKQLLRIAPYKKEDEPLLHSKQVKIGAEIMELIKQVFFKYASEGRSFGPIERIKEFFGGTLEENYGFNTGPFIDMARTFWTFKIEINDIVVPPSALRAILGSVELEISGIFFPSPGPATVPVNTRITAQRKFLEIYAPRMDVERFISENPLLKKDIAEQSRNGGCFGNLVVLFSLLIMCILIFIIGPFI